MKKLSLFWVAMTVAMVANAANLYQKVTTTPTDWEGTYLIVCTSQSVVFNGNAAEDDMDAKSGPAIIQSITLGADTLMGSAALDSATFTIASTGDSIWQWSIQSHSGFYIGHKDTADNGLSVETEVKKKCKHTLAIEDGNLIATPYWEVNGEYNLRYNKDADQMRFRYYKPDKKQSIQLYKLVTNPTAVESTFDTPSTNVHKVIRNGRLLILKDGIEYNVLGN